MSINAEVNLILSDDNNIIIDLNNKDVEYHQVPEQVATSCSGCAFNDDGNCLADSLNISISICIRNSVIWQEIPNGQ
jgi:hypothetical protein